MYKLYRIFFWKRSLNTYVTLKIGTKGFNSIEDEFSLQIKSLATKNCEDSKKLNLIQKSNSIGLPRHDTIANPTLANIRPITINYRHIVLEECGINVSPEKIVNYLNIVKQNIGYLKAAGAISHSLDMKNHLANIISQNPQALTAKITEDYNEFTLYILRMKIVQKYLEFELKLTEDKFHEALKLYPNIKHRPLKNIREMLQLVRNEISMSDDKIKSNFFLFYGNPDNLKNILCSLKTIGDMDIREILRKHPHLIIKNCSKLLEIKHILTEFGIQTEAQRRALKLFTLSPHTVRERLERSKEIPELSVLFNHPRFLNVIYNYKLSLKRLKDLNDQGKKCISISCLLDIDVYQKCINQCDDKIRSNRDLVYYLNNIFNKLCTKKDIKKTLEIDQTWKNIPLSEIKHVFDNLNSHFSTNDIYQNFSILFYPWSEINNVIRSLDSSNENISTEEIKFKNIPENQEKLSIVLNYLKNNYNCK